MAGLIGPISISGNLQVRLPVRVARELHVKPGDEYFVRTSDEEPGTIFLIPAEVVERRYSHGETVERASRGENFTLVPTPDN